MEFFKKMLQTGAVAVAMSGAEVKAASPTSPEPTPAKPTIETVAPSLERAHANAAMVELSAKLDYLTADDVTAIKAILDRRISERERAAQARPNDGDPRMDKISSLTEEEWNAYSKELSGLMKAARERVSGFERQRADLINAQMLQVNLLGIEGGEAHEAAKKKLTELEANPPFAAEIHEATEAYELAKDNYKSAISLKGTGEVQRTVEKTTGGLNATKETLGGLKKK